MAQTQDSRILIKRDTNTGVVPTVPTSNDHLDGSWIKSDIYVGEAFINTTDKRMWIRTSGGIIELESLMLSQKGSHRFAVASGTNTYTASLSPSLTAYAAGNPFKIKFTNANTGSSTINIDSLGAKTIKKNGNTDLVSGDIQAGAIYSLVYDGTNFQIVGSQGVSTSGTYTPTVTLSAYMSGATASPCQYMRVGNVVTVSGKIQAADDGTPAQNALFYISLPIATSISSSSYRYILAGTGSYYDGSVPENLSIPITGYETPANAALFSYPTLAATIDIYFSFTYLIQ